MNERLAGREKRHTEEAVFLCEILDDLTTIAEKIKSHPETITELSLSNITIDALAPPASLPVPSHSHGSPAELSVSAVATRDHVALEAIRIEPSESSPIEIVNDGGLARIDDGYMTQHQELNALHDSLLTLLPPAYRTDAATVPNLIEYARQCAPCTHEVATLTTEDSARETVTTIQLIELETNTDSLRSVDISVKHPHPSGKQVGTRLILTESLVRRTNNRIARDEVERSINVEAVDDQGLDTLLLQDTLLESDGTKQTIAVNPATRHHIAYITAALANLTAA